MPHSSRYSFHIGDRVRNRYSQEEGRVTNLTPLADGVLLVTVAVFVAGLFARNDEVRVVPGAIGGPLEVVSRVAGAGGSAVANLLNPTQAGGISAQAEAVAIADDIVNATMRNVITERLAVMTHGRLDRLVRGASPSLERTSAEAASDAIWDRVRDFERRYNAVFKAKGQIDLHVGYLTSPGTVNEQGQWMGSYLADVVHGRRRAHAEVAKKAAPLERILERTRITPQLRQKYGSLIPGEVQTGYDLLLHFRLHVEGLASRDRAPLWREYGAILSEVVQQHPGYQNLKQLAARLPEVIGGLRHRQREVLEHVPGAANWADPRRDNSGFRDKGLTEAQTSRDIGRRAYSEMKEAGHEQPEIDVGWVRRVQTEARLRARNQRAGLTPKPLPRKGKLETFYQGKAQIGTVVEYNRVPHVISAIDAKTMRVTMTPVGSDAVLYSKGILNNTEEMAAFTRRLADRNFRPASALSSTLSRQVASVRTVRVRGGLLGNLHGTADIPIPLLHAFMEGKAPQTEAALFKLLTGKEMASAVSMPGGTMARWGSQVSRLQEVQRRFLHQEMQRLGIGSFSQLREGARKFGSRFRGLVGIPYEQISQTRKLVEPGDVRSTAFLTADKHLRGVRSGMTMGELAQDVAGRVRRDVLKDVRVGQGPRMEQFSQITTSVKDGEVLVGEEAIDRMGAVNIFQAATETPGRSRMLQIEFEHRLRKQAKNAAQGELAVFHELFGDLLPGRSATPERPERIVARQGMASRATRIGKSLRAGERDQVMGSFQELAEALNIELVQGSVDLRQAYQLLVKAQREAGGRVTPAVRRAAKRVAILEGAEFAAGDAYLAQREVSYLENTAEMSMVEVLLRDGQREAKATLNRVRGYFPIAADERARFAQALNPLIEMAEGGDFQPLREFGADFRVNQSGKVGVLLHGRQNLHDPHTYYRTSETAGYASNRRGHIVPFGMEAVDLTEAEIYDAMVFGRLHLRREEGALVTEGAFRLQQLGLSSAADEVREAALQRGSRLLPLFETGDGGRIGFTPADPINAKSVFQRTRELARHEGRLIGLDVETDIKTGQILNLTAQQYELKDGQVVRTGERLDLATPEFFAQGDLGKALDDPLNLDRIREARVSNVTQALEHGTVSEATRTITKNGTPVVIDEIVRDEQEIVRRAADYLKRNPETVVGHHIGFDFTHLIDAARLHGMTEEFNILHEAAGGRLADTMVGWQAALPEAKELSLEALYRGITGKKLAEVHVASPDVDWTMELLPHLQQHARQIEERLGSAKQIRLKETQYVVDRQQRRVYQIAGVIDPRKAAELYQQETGEILQQAVGVALQPLDFATGKPEGPLEFRAAKTPHGFGSSFFGRHELLPNKAAALAELEGTAEDLARRRVRRMVTNDEARRVSRSRGPLAAGPFTEVLLEEERLKLLGPLAEGKLGEAQWELLQRSRSAGSAAEREVARRTHQWSLDQLGDSRIQRQLQLEQRFIAEEAQGVHKPIVDWLKESLVGTDAAGSQPATTQANAVWEAYLRQAAGIEAVPTIRGTEIPLAQQKVTIELPILAHKEGEAVKKAIRVGSLEQAESDARTIVQRIARRLNRERPGELLAVMRGASLADIQDFQQRLRAGKNILDTNLGPAVEQHIHERYLLPAIQQARFQMHGADAALPVEGQSLAEALPQVVRQGQAAAQKFVEQMPDNLTPRAFGNGEALAALQQRFTGGSVADVHRGLEDAALVFDPRHGAPQEWVGQPVSQVVRQAAAAGTEGRSDFTRTLRGIARQMNPTERQGLNTILQKQKPGWIDEVMHRGAVPAAPAGKAVRAFEPGIGHRLGIELSGKLTQNKAALQKLGIGAALAVGGLLAIRAFSGPGQPAPTPDSQGKPNGTASTEAEVERRHQRVLRQQLLTHKVRVNVAAEDAQGVGHQAITDSIHEALGSFFGRQIAHQADVHDHRSPITKEYLDRIAHHLFTNEQRPGVPIPA